MSARTILWTAILLCSSEACRQTPAPPPTPARQTTSADATTAPAATASSSAPATDIRHCTPGEATLCPVDEGESDPSFAKYRQQLRAAVARRSADDVLKLVDPHIRTSFGEGGGLAAFRELLADSPSGAHVWQELSNAIALGGTFRGDGGERMFWAPYVYSAWPEKFDSFQYMAAVRDQVPLRERPSTSAPVVTSIDWAIVEWIEDTAQDPAWRHVRTADGRTGWVQGEDVRSPVGYRAGFHVLNGEWKMSAFVSGD